MPQTAQSSRGLTHSVDKQSVYSVVIPARTAHYQTVGRLRRFVGNKEPCCVTSQHLTLLYPIRHISSH